MQLRFACRAGTAEVKHGTKRSSRAKKRKTAHTKQGAFIRKKMETKVLKESRTERKTCSVSSLMKCFYALSEVLELFGWKWNIRYCYVTKGVWELFCVG